MRQHLRTGSVRNLLVLLEPVEHCHGQGHRCTINMIIHMDMVRAEANQCHAAWINLIAQKQRAVIRSVFSQRQITLPSEEGNAANCRNTEVVNHEHASRYVE